MNKIIEVKNLSYTFSGSDKKILSNLNFSVSNGEFLGIIGPNGGGKTTFIKLILGLIKKEKESEILLWNTPLNEFKNWEKISFISQKNSITFENFPASVKEIVSLGFLKLKSKPTKKEREKMIIQSLNEVQMLEYINESFSKLSGGQQQRILIARAIISNPELLILDEPSVGIDPNSQESFCKLLHHLRASHKITILLVSHDIDYITKEATTLAFINQQLLYHGPATNSVEKYYHHSHQHA